MQQYVDLKEIEVAFQRFNRYCDTLLKADYWAIKMRMSDLIAFCLNNRVISLILDPIITNNTFYNKSLNELIIRDNKFDIGEDFNKYVIIFTILSQTVNGSMDGINEFAQIFGETNKNQAAYKFNSNLVKPLLVKLSGDFQNIYNSISSKNKITLNDIGIYEQYRVESSELYNDEIDNNEDEKAEEAIKNKAIDFRNDFEQLSEIVMQNPRINQDIKTIILNDINDILKILLGENIENRKIEIFNLINDIGLRSNWVIGKMDENISHPLISELVKIWALRQIGLRS